MPVKRRFGLAAKVQDIRQASARALLGERVNRLVNAVVMESRGIYMSADVKAAEELTEPAAQLSREADQVLATMRS